MSNEFNNKFCNAKKVLSINALKESIIKSQDYLLTELLAKIIMSLYDISPRYFDKHLIPIINLAVAFGWRASKDLEDFEHLEKKIQEEKEKQKYSSYIK